MVRAPKKYGTRLMFILDGASRGMFRFSPMVTFSQKQPIFWSFWGKNPVFCIFEALNPKNSYQSPSIPMFIFDGASHGMFRFSPMVTFFEKNPYFGLFGQNIVKQQLILEAYPKTTYLPSSLMVFNLKWENQRRNK